MTKMRGWCNLDFPGEGRNLSKADRKNLEKSSKLNIHLMALLNAVEHGQVEKARTILQNNTFDINGLNQDGLSVLATAVMIGNVPIVKTLQQAGAIETNTDSFEHRLKHLEDLLLAAERKRSELASIMSNGNFSKDTEREHQKWDRRSKFIKKMKIGLEKLQVPKLCQHAAVDVIDGTRVRIGFKESLLQQSNIATKFKVEWSTEDWKSVSGSLELFDLRRTSAVIEGLAQGRRHHFRICAGNMRGYGPPVMTSPPSSVPSSWRDIDNRKPRLEGLLVELETLFKQIRNSRPEHASEIKAIEPCQETPSVHRKAQKKKSLMQLFTHAPKFHKSLKRGSYLATIVYCEDKILVTTEDFPPVIEVDDNYLSAARPHFHWLMKVATTWEDVKSLRQDMEQAGSSSQLPYRIKLLQAAASMQSAVGLQDLGQFYHKPLKDCNGTYVFCTVKHVKSTKAISTMNFRWVPLSKLKERKTSVQGGTPISGESLPTAGELLISSLREQITYSQASQVPLKRGLHLGYLKLQSSVDQLQVITPVRIPNFFPHVKIRDNPHVSREEWEWMQNVNQDSLPKTDDPGGGEESSQDSSPSNVSPPSPAQSSWQKQLILGAQQLLQELNVEKEKWRDHRLFTAEALELNNDVTLLLLLPPLDAVCCAPGQEDNLVNHPTLTALPLHTFEMIHMGSYQGHLLGRYTRLSYILEMDTFMAQHANREAFSESEVTWTKDRLWQLKQFQLVLDSIWKRFRWVMDVITFARDKTMPGLPLAALCQNIEKRTDLYREVTSNNRNPIITTETLSSGTDYKRFRYEFRSSFRQKKSSALSKSNTTDNLKTLSTNELNLPKSKTSDCVFSSNSSLRISKSDPLSTELVHRIPSSDTIPLIQWTAEEPCGSMMESHMYSKENPTARSDYLLRAHTPSVELPPRKSSAPSFLESGHLTEPECPDNKYEDITSAASLDTLTAKFLQRERRASDEAVSAREKNSPSTSYCSEFGQKQGTSGYNSDKRTNSSLSHESEASFSSLAPSLRSISSNELENAVSLESVTDNARRSSEPAVIQVYAAYETGLASGTSVKLNLTPRTTAREVIDLVVKQLNMAVVLKKKNGPIYGTEKLKNFCLVAVIGARERCLRDDFQPLQLQNPWKKGRLYVRLKNDLLAAIEQNNSKYSSYL